MPDGSASERAHGQRRTTLVSLGAAAGLVGLKLGVGLATGSLALVSGGIESSGDVIAAMLTFFAVRLSGRPADPGHPYGHRRAENLGALGEATLLIAGGVVVTVEAITRLVAGGGPGHVDGYVLAVIGVALVIDLSRTTVSLRAARRYESPALHSNAMHFAGDLAGSVAILAGLLAVRAGFHDGDAVAALVVAAIIALAGARLIAVNANVLMDRTPAEARVAAEHAIAAIGEDIELSRLRLRESAGRFFADVVVSVPAGQALVEGHRSADLVEEAVEGALPGSDVVVHVEPRARGGDLRDRVLAIALTEPLVKEAHDIAIFEQGDDSASVSLHLKFPTDLDLRGAHEVAERIEAEIRELPRVVDVQTHLEPLERPLAARPAEEAPAREARREAQRLVRARTGTDPRRLSLISTEAGRVLFLTLRVDHHQSLSDAHRLAGEVEEELRQRIGGIADVVVHTEP